MKQAVLLIDAGHLRAVAEEQGLRFESSSFVRLVANNSFNFREEEIFRVLYYDARPFYICREKPINHTEVKIYRGNRQFQNELGNLDYFALRLGKIRFRGWRLDEDYFKNPEHVLTDDDFKESLEQKEVDVRIAMDIAVYADTKCCDRIILMSLDTDLIPAVKHGRKAGVQMVLAMLPDSRPKTRFCEYFDICRDVQWPEAGTY